MFLILNRMPTLGCKCPPWSLGMGYRYFADQRDGDKKPDSRCPEKECGKERESMWYNPKCCVDPCKGAIPRYDWLYYKPSDKRRTAGRTWAEFPQLKIVPKKVCCFETTALPPIERRVHKPRELARECSADIELVPCHTKTHKNCVKICMPGCKAPRDPPSCLLERVPKQCDKVCAPCPSYSECDRPKLRPLRPKECRCVYVGPLCMYR